MTSRTFVIAMAFLVVATATIRPAASVADDATTVRRSHFLRGA